MLACAPEQLKKNLHRYDLSTSNLESSSRWGQCSWRLRATDFGHRLLYLRACVLNRFSRVWLFETLRAISHQAPLSRGFYLQEYWSGLPCPSSGALCWHHHGRGEYSDKDHLAGRSWKNSDPSVSLQEECLVSYSRVKQKRSQYWRRCQRAEVFGEWKSGVGRNSRQVLGLRIFRTYKTECKV